MRTRIFTLLVALMCLPLVGRGQSVWDGTADVSWYNEGQTEFTITTAEELAGLAQLNKSFDGKTIKLGANIILNEDVLNAEKELNEGDFHEWTPIDGFSGTFDGQGHTISGLYIIRNDNHEGKHIGLFATAGNSENNDDFVEIKNIGVIDSYIKGNDIDYVAGICAEMGVSYSGSGPDNFITNCYFDGLIEATNPMYIGGISAYSFETSSKIENCYNLGTINVDISKLINDPSYFIYGIGVTERAYNCYNAGNINVKVNITSNTTSTSLATISIGGISNVQIASCYNTGNINIEGSISNILSAVSVGGIAGSAQYIQYCYNKGVIDSTITDATFYGVGSILGLDWDTNLSLIDNYYEKTSDEKGVGGTISGTDYDEKENETQGITDFSSGWLAWEMGKNIQVSRKDIDGNDIGEPREITGYGQQLTANGEAIDETPVLLAFDENKGKEVYQLTLSAAESSNITIDDTPIYRIAIPSNLLPEETYSSIKEDAGEGRDVVWKDEDGNVVISGNKYTPTKDIALTATIDNVYDINTEVTPEDAGTISVKESAAEGETVSFTVTANEGYELSSTYYIEEGKEEQVSITNTFSMPASNITIYAVFTEIETEEPEQPGGDEDDDEDQGNTGIHKPQRPIKYYNIYVDTICPGLNVEVSKDVVQEGHQVSAYLTIQAECDTTGMRFEYKRGLFGYWKDLKELEGVQPGEYIIKNIYTDIYIRALDATLPEEEPTGVEDIESVKAYAKDGSIYIYTPNREEVMIIGMTGAIIKNEEQVGLQSYNVSRGIYIVRVGDKVFKLKN